MFTTELKKLTLPLFLAGAFMIFSQLASTVQAMCVYNDMDVQSQMVFGCGFLCENNWTLDPGGSACRPGEAGTVMVGPGCGEAGCLTYASIDVDAHGYAVLFTAGANGQRNICAYHQDDSLDHCVYFTYP